METKQYQIQEYLFGWYNLDNMLFNTHREAKEAIKEKETKRNKSNKRIRKQDFNMNGYGIEADYPTRIIVIDSSKPLKKGNANGLQSKIK